MQQGFLSSKAPLSDQWSLEQANNGEKIYERRHTFYNTYSVRLFISSHGDYSKCNLKSTLQALKMQYLICTEGM